MIPQSATLLSLLTLFLFACFDLDSAAQESDKKALTANEAKLLWDIARAETRVPLQKLNEKLDQALERLSGELQQEGNLEGVLFIRKERETFPDRVKPAGPSDIAKLNELRSIYWKERTRIEATIAIEDQAALREYLKNLDEIVINLTKSGKVEEALAVREELEKAKKGLHSNPSPLSLEEKEIILGAEENYKLIENCEVTKQGNRFVLTSNEVHNTYVSSKKNFRAPFRIRVRAMTDGENIRFYYCQKGRVILNWEVRNRDLRIHEPITGRKHSLQGEGFVEPGEMHDIEIAVSKQGVGVYVNGIQRGEVKGDFTNARGTVGIGPAHGSIITVESFVVVED